MISSEQRFWSANGQQTAEEEEDEEVEGYPRHLEIRRAFRSKQRGNRQEFLFIEYFWFR